MKKSLLNGQKASLEKTDSLLGTDNQHIDAANNAITTTAATAPLNTVTVNSNFTVNGDFEANVGLGQNFAVNVYDEGIEETARLYYSLNNNAFKFDSELYVRGTAFFGAVACNGVAESAALQSGSLRMSSRPTTPGVRASTWDVVPTEDQSLSFSNLIHGVGGGLRAQLTAAGRFKLPAAPLAPEDLTNKAYVDAKVTGLADLSSAQTFTGQKTFLGRIEQKHAEGFDLWYTGPVLNESFSIVDSNNDGLIISPWDGNKITGDLTATGRVKSALAPTEAEHLTNKAYVDSKIGSYVDLSTTQAIAGDKTFKGTTRLTKSTYSAAEGLDEWYVQPNDDNTKFYIADPNGEGLYLIPSGTSILYGGLKVYRHVESSLTPTLPEHLTNKAYVDSKITSGTYTPEVAADLASLTITPGRHHYTKVGNQVTVYGSVSLFFTDIIDYSFFITLPISSNLSDSEDLVGVGSIEGGGGAKFYIVPESFGDRVQVTFISASSNQTSIATYSFMYTIT